MARWRRALNSQASGKKCRPTIKMTAGMNHACKPMFFRTLPTMKMAIHCPALTTLKDGDPLPRVDDIEQPAHALGLRRLFRLRVRGPVAPELAPRQHEQQDGDCGNRQQP